MPTGNAEPSIIADAKPIIEACIIYLYIVYEQKKMFISKKLFETKTLVLVFKVVFNPKPRFGVEKLRIWFGIKMVHFNYKLYRVFFDVNL